MVIFMTEPFSQAQTRDQIALCWLYSHFVIPALATGIKGLKVVGCGGQVRRCGGLVVPAS